MPGDVLGPCGKFPAVFARVSFVYSTAFCGSTRLKITTEGTKVTRNWLLGGFLRSCGKFQSVFA
jgi:hypothetical protein